MSRPKIKFLVLDTETCNTLEQPLPYDIGWVICDKEGTIYEEHSFVIADTFIDMSDVMQTAYYAEKLPRYKKDMRNGTRKMATLYTIRKLMLDEMKKHKVKKVGAYNMGFDLRALNTIIRYSTKSKYRYWFPYNTEFFCIWNMACNTILNRPSYIKTALENGFISEKGNILTSAECAYRYITNEIDFIESHTGLEDVKIEVAIMVKCFKQHKKMDMNINSACWVKVKKFAKEWIERNPLYPIQIGVIL